MKQTDFVVTLFEGKENPENLTVAAVMALNAWISALPSRRWADSWRSF